MASGPDVKMTLVRQLRTEIEIAAPAEQVWRILANFNSYAAWNPFVIRIEGSPTAGARLTVRIEPPGGRGMTFRPVVLLAVAPRELRWIGRLIFPGIFDGEHSFQIQSLDSGKVRFVQEETFRGILVPLLWPFMHHNTRAGFEAMNAALKVHAESRG